jgi:hypothetical protein
MRLKNIVLEKTRTMKKMVVVLCAMASVMTSAETNKDIYFGDTPLHSAYSFDAFLNNNHSVDPDIACRWAKVQPVIHPYNRARVQIDTSLSKIAVDNDHAAQFKMPVITFQT